MKSLRKLDRGIARRILSASDALALDPRPHGCKHLTGGSGELRIRVGDPGIVLQKIVLDFGGMKRSYLGPQSTLIE